MAGSPLWRAGSMPATGFRRSRARRWADRPEVRQLRADRRPVRRSGRTAGGAPPQGAPAPAETEPVPAEAPSAYLRRVYVDTLTFSEPALRCAQAVFGPDRLLFGTDWPPVGIPTAVSRMLIDRLDVSDDERAGILGGNAAALLKLQ